MKQIQDATSEDQIFQSLHDTIISGWPKKKSECNPELLQFFNYRDELTVNNGVILKGDTIVIPHQLRKKILSQLHVGHIGIQGTIRRARDVIFWPGITNDIK